MMKIPTLEQSFNKEFLSEADQLLAELRAKLPKSASQQETIRKHERIAKLRDDADAAGDDSPIWEEF